MSIALLLKNAQCSSLIGSLLESSLYPILDESGVLTRQHLSDLARL